jgi:hypothetical protein
VEARFRRTLRALESQAVADGILRWQLTYVIAGSRKSAAAKWPTISPQNALIPAKLLIPLSKCPEKIIMQNRVFLTFR